MASTHLREQESAHQNWLLGKDGALRPPLGENKNL